MVDALVRSGAVDLIVVDSVAALVPRAEIEGDMGDSLPGLQARLMSQALRKLTASIGRSNCTVIFINQIRMKIGVMFGNPETTSGGNALKFFASQRLEIRKGEKIIGDDKEQNGYICKIKTAKNKIFAPFKTVEVPIKWAEGISKSDDIVEASVILKLITRNGAFYTFGDQKFQGKAKMVDFITTDEKGRKELELQIQSKIKDMRSGKAVLDEDALNLLTEDMHAPVIEEIIDDME
jgi:recombination protein RecA